MDKNVLLICFIFIYNDYTQAELNTTVTNTDISTTTVATTTSDASTLNKTLRCYFCASTGPKCDNATMFIEARKGKRPDLIKNCTYPYDKMCVIETHSSGGNTQAHIRDCSDGNFTFSSEAKGTYTRLLDLKKNNETSCVLNSATLTCLSKCETDYCNGPQYDKDSETDGADRPSVLLHCIVSVALIVTFTS